MGLFSNSSQNVPVQLVGQLRAQSKSDHEIIDELGRQGYSSIDIYNALNQADQQPQQGSAQFSGSDQGFQQSQPSQPERAQSPGAQSQPRANAANADPWATQDQVSPGQAPQSQAPQQQWNPPQPQRSPEPESQSWQEPPIIRAAPSQPTSQPQSQPSSRPESSNPFSGQSQQSYDAPSQPPQRPPAPIFTDAPNHNSQPSRSAPTFGSDATIDQIDQIAEAIIDEKWKEMKLYIEKIVDWKGKVENRILAVEESQKTLNAQIIGLQKSLLDKVQTYDRHITDVGTEIKAMEKVFQKIIPSLTENVNELSSVVHRMKDDQ